MREAEPMHERREDFHRRVYIQLTLKWLYAAAQRLKYINGENKYF